MSLIGIVGFGFVGKALYYGFGDSVSFAINDPKLDTSVPLERLAESCSIIFIAVPTPMDLASGEIDSSIMDFVIDKLAACDTEAVIVVKSTVIPSILSGYRDKYPQLRIVMNPEFLTERNALEDFRNQNRIILGGDPDDTMKVGAFYKENGYENVVQRHMSLEAASLVKYLGNTFLATKLSFMNEWYCLAKSVGLEEEWSSIVEAFLDDQRIGRSHTQVPGPEGSLGWGGKCFPKDLNALVKYAEFQSGMDMTMLKAAWKTNLKVRTDKDWEAIEGATTNG